MAHPPKSLLKRLLIGTAKWCLTLLLCVGLTGGLAFFKYSEITHAIEQAAAYPEQSETVESETVGQTDWAPSVRVIGTAVAPRRVVFHAELPGRIEAVNARPGAAVKRGQVLVQQDISQEQAQLASAEAKVDLHRLTAGRMQRLQEQNAGSAADADKASADLRIALADVEALKSTIRKKTITAPVDGVLGLHQLEAGQYLREGDTVGTMVGTTKTVWIDFRLPQAWAGLRTGAEVQVSQIQQDHTDVPAPVTAHVIATESTMASTSRSLMYRAEVPLSELPLRHNAAVEVLVPTAPSKTVTSVAAASVLQDRTSRYVYVLQPEEQPGQYRAHRQVVHVAGRQQDRLLIERGLQPGQLIAGPGAFKLQEGLLVFTRKESAQTSEPSDSAAL